MEVANRPPKHFKRFRFGNYPAGRFAEMVGWNIKVISGILGEECVDLYRASPTLTR